MVRHAHARRRLVTALLCVTATLTFTAPTAHAQGTLAPLSGFGFDLNLDGGVGFALRDALDNNFLASIRVGALYVREPFVFALGATGELGGLAGYGLGGALEVSHFDGPWARAGASRVQHDEWMSQLTLGYMFFGVQWQHRFTDRQQSDALMFVFRVPVGLWWFLMDDPAPSHRAHPPHAESPSASVTRLSTPPPQAPVGDRVLAERLRTEAGLAEQQEQWRDAAALLERAERLDPSPLTTLRLARAQRKAQHVVAAAESLQRFVAAAVTPEEISAKSEAERERLEALSLIAHLRLRVEPLDDHHSVWLDDQPFSRAALGFPYPIDPGTHVIVIKRDDVVISRRELHATPGQSIALSLDPRTDATPPDLGTPTAE